LVPPNVKSKLEMQGSFIVLGILNFILTFGMTKPTKILKRLDKNEREIKKKEKIESGKSLNSKGL